MLTNYFNVNNKKPKNQLPKQEFTEEDESKPWIEKYRPKSLD